MSTGTPAAEVNVEAELLRELLRELARVLAESLGNLQCDVAGDIAVRFDLGAFEHHARVAHAERGERTREQVGKLLFLLRKHPGAGAAAKGRILAAREWTSAPCSTRALTASRRPRFAAS